MTISDGRWRAARRWSATDRLARPALWAHRPDVESRASRARRPPA